MVPHFWSGHYSLYVINKYTRKFVILDSRKYALLTHTTRKEHHSHCVQIVSSYMLREGGVVLGGSYLLFFASFLILGIFFCLYV